MNESKSTWLAYVCLRWVIIASAAILVFLTTYNKVYIPWPGQAGLVFLCMTFNLWHYGFINGTAPHQLTCWHYVTILIIAGVWRLLDVWACWVGSVARPSHQTPWQLVLKSFAGGMCHQHCLLWRHNYRVPPSVCCLLVGDLPLP